MFTHEKKLGKKQTRDICIRNYDELKVGDIKRAFKLEGRVNPARSPIVPVSVVFPSPAAKGRAKSSLLTNVRTRRKKEKTKKKRRKFCSRASLSAFDVL